VTIWRILFVLCIIMIIVLIIWGSIFTWNMTRWEMFMKGWLFSVSILVLGLTAWWIEDKIGPWL
jgi:hypothetical protein